ncbi:MAG: hypothetical protein ACK4MX_06360 [Thermaurantiacus sp.]
MPLAPKSFLLVLGVLAFGAPAAAQVSRVPVKPSQPQTTAETWVEGRARRGACIDASAIAGAYVLDPQTLEVVMRGGARHRVRFAAACPQLSYYGGFYYQPAEAGQLCAGRDRIMGRAGGACRISAIVPLIRRPPR